MLIYGYRNRTIEQGTGIFQCPNCRDQRAYTRKKVVRYFTLFFIPLFPLGTLSEYIECQLCRRTYQPGIFASAGNLLMDAAGQAAHAADRSNALASSEIPAKNNSCLPIGL